MSQTYADLSSELQTLFTQLQEAFANIGSNDAGVGFQMSNDIAHKFSTFNSGGTFDDVAIATVDELTRLIWQG